MRDITPEAPLTYAKIEAWEHANLRRYWEDYGLPAIDPILRLDWTSKPNFVRAVAKAYGLRTFVETGSHEGEMIAQVLRAPAVVDRVYSVELGDEVNPGTSYPEKCRQRFKGDTRVQLWEGDSVAAIRWMLEAFDGPALFWLDAHANGPEDRDPHHFPVSQELTLLATQGSPYYREGSVILVDDARFFGVGHWPSLTEVMLYGRSAALAHDIVRIEL
jgi:hypothetical protein